MKRWTALTLVLAMALALTSGSAWAREQFVRALEPCLDYVRKEASGQHFQLVMDQGWLALLFPLESAQAGLGSDLCGELGNGGLAFGGGYAWPAELGPENGPENSGIDRSMVNAAWLERAIIAARTSARTSAPVRRVTLTALPEPREYLVRVQFGSAEAEAERAEGASVDLNRKLRVVARDVRIPDELPRQVAGAQSEASGETAAAPTVDPIAAYGLLLEKTEAAGSRAKVARVALANFGANLNYRNPGSNGMRQTAYDYIDAQATNLRDEVFEFPAAFKPCTMSLAEAQFAIEHVVTVARVRELAPRLQHLILECSAKNPKPHWSAIAMDPFEYFDLPAKLTQ